MRRARILHAASARRARDFKGKDSICNQYKKEDTKMERITTKKAPAAIGPYSQAHRTGNLLFTSGQVALDP